MRIRYTRRALLDVNAIAVYIAPHNRRAALSVELAIVGTVNRLVDFPMLGTEEKELDVRRLLVPKYPYAIYYRIEGEEIWIVHVRYGRRKPPEVGDV